MKVVVKSVADMGSVARLVRKNQNLDQATIAAFAGSGLSFVSQFENGKQTAEIGRVLSLFDVLGIEVVLDIPQGASDLSTRELTELDLVMQNFCNKKVESLSGLKVGYVVSQIPDFATGVGFQLHVAWGVSNLLDAQSLPPSELSVEYCSTVTLV